MIRSGIILTRESQFSTHDVSFVHSPVAITDGSPFVVIEYLNTTGMIIDTIRKSNRILINRNIW